MWLALLSGWYCDIVGESMRSQPCKTGVWCHQVESCVFSIAVVPITAHAFLDICRWSRIEDRYFSF